SLIDGKTVGGIVDLILETMRPNALETNPDFWAKERVGKIVTELMELSDDLDRQCSDAWDEGFNAAVKGHQLRFECLSDDKDDCGRYEPIEDDIPDAYSEAPLRDAYIAGIKDAVDSADVRFD